MCEPVTIAMAAATAVSAVGAYNESKSAKAAAKYNAAVQENNAQFSEWQAQDALDRGQLQQQDNRRRGEQIAGTQRAAIAANGIVMDEGSPLAILQDTEFATARDAQVIRDNANREAYGFRQQAQNARAGAAITRYQGDSINTGLNVASSLLSGGSKVAGQWYSYKSSQQGTT